MQSTTQTLLGYSAAAERLGVSVRTLESAVAGKQIPCVRIGKRVWFLLDDVDAFQAIRTQEPTAP